jgi:DNA/RNA-binding domain of Phe-tRNA-synthetase-like protein
MMQISFQKELLEKIPSIGLGCIQCKVEVLPSDDKIKELSEEIITQIQSKLTVETIGQKPTIKSTKEAYRKLGKDPSRYRPSAEALRRRIVKGKSLYNVNNVVDLLNLVSLESGFSIGGYDADKINGPIEFGIGIPDEPYQAIGRGKLNIENLPLFRDAAGAFGSPTSDSIRTMVTDQTTSFLMILIDFNTQGELMHFVERSVELLGKYASATSVETKVFSSTT